MNKIPNGQLPNASHQWLPYIAKYRGFFPHVIHFCGEDIDIVYLRAPSGGAKPPVTCYSDLGLKRKLVIFLGGEFYFLGGRKTSIPRQICIREKTLVSDLQFDNDFWKIICIKNTKDIIKVFGHKNCNNFGIISQVTGRS